MAIGFFLAAWVFASAVCAQAVPGVTRGVNLGGWLVTEEWITPSLYRSGTHDEWSLCAALGKSRCSSLLERHWSSFITLDDFEQMKAAGLNSVRIPIGYWAVDVLDAEPYVGGQYPYLIRAVQWAREVGFTVLLDLHGAPGSQNGQDNSGLTGVEQFAANTTNLERTVGVLRNLSEEFTRAEYGGVVTGIEVLNEPRLSGNFSMGYLESLYARAATVIQGPNVTVHDAFWGPAYWADTPYTIDTHQYYAFEPLANLSRADILESVCNISAVLKRGDLQPTLVGEFSLETGSPPNASIGSREDSQERRTWFRLLFESQQAAYEPNAPGQASLGWYYWTWTTEWEIDTWSYRRGVRDGYIPTDVSNASTFAFPRLADGCVDASFDYTAPRRPSPDPVSGPGWWWGGAGSRMSVQRGLLFAALSVGLLALV